MFWWWHLCHAQPNSQRWQSQLRHPQPQQPNLPAHTPPEIALGGLRNPTGFQPISSCLESVINCNCLSDFISIFSGSGQFGKALWVPTGENAPQCMHLLVWSYQLPSGSAFLRASLENETHPLGNYHFFLSCVVTDKKISVPAGDMSSNQGSVQAQLGSTRLKLPASHKVFWQIALTGIFKKDADLALAEIKRFSFLLHINFLVSQNNRKDSEKIMGNLQRKKKGNVWPGLKSNWYSRLQLHPFSKSYRIREWFQGIPRLDWAWNNLA